MRDSILQPFSSLRLTLIVAFILSVVQSVNANQEVLNQQDLPIVTLPWGSWRANSIDPTSNIVAFQNIRFAKAPTGNLRFQRPQFPDPIDSPEEAIQDNTYGPTCYQVDTHPSCVPPKPLIPASEDCLFLDIYVPQAILEQAQNGVAVNAPVVVWFYGGAYEFGAKSAYGPAIPLYEGYGAINASTSFNQQFIFVAGNYRLGAFGWLAGPTMETSATANAGLYDQRLVLEFVQKYISLFGGDKTQVAAWGESAGAGSILHHLIAQNGTQDPLFQKVFIQSPAFQWQWDRSPGGTLDQVFNNFTKLSNCPERDFSCLVAVQSDVLVLANQALYDQSQEVGLFPLGPAVDNEWIYQLPNIAYMTGNFWKHLESLAISHVKYESVNFIPKFVKTPKDFDYYLEEFIREPQLENVREAIRGQYPSSKYNGDQSARVGAVIQDSSFVCNTRIMYNAYSPLMDVHMMSYDFVASYATHASDLLPAFWDTSFDVEDFLHKYICVASEFWVTVYANAMNQIGPAYQSYLADLAVSGNPNTHPKPDWVPAWIPASNSTDHNFVENALLVQLSPYFQQSYQDPLNTMAICSFWNTVSQNISQELDKIQSNTADAKSNRLRDWTDMSREL